MIPSIKQVASELNLPLIDAYALLVNHSECFLDGAHPNCDGAQAIATAIYYTVNSGDSK